MDFVDTGVTRNPVTQRVYQSSATVSSARTHRSVTGSNANTSNRVLSISKYSPGRVGRSFPYASVGRSAISRFRLVLNRNVGWRRSNTAKTRNAVDRDGCRNNIGPIAGDNPGVRPSNDHRFRRA